jgi:hypothetical protein
VFSWEQDHQAHGRTEIWIFLAQVFMSMTFTLMRTIPRSRTAIKVVNLAVVFCLYMLQVSSFIVVFAYS